MHGGAKGSGGPRGERNGNFKHGFDRHDEAKTEHKSVRAQISAIKAVFKAAR